jgi:arylsulfatase A-like enzyme
MLPRFAIVLTVVTVVGAVIGFALIRLSEGRMEARLHRGTEPSPAMPDGARLRPSPSSISSAYRRGHDPVHSEDVTTVPLAPNSSGTFGVTSHSGPWDYLQNVPLVFYGPGFIKASDEPVEGPVETVDVYPTVGELAGVDLPRRDGRALEEILEQAGRALPS